MTVDLTSTALRVVSDGGLIICLVTLSLLPTYYFRFFGTSVLTYPPLFVTVLVLTRWVCMKIRSRGVPLPPGPSGLPILGFLPFLGQQFHLTLTDLGKRFGPVYQLYLGGKRVVVLSDPKLVRKAFLQSAFSGRPDTELTKVLQGYGIINSEGALWKEQRAFLHTVLREFGAKNSQGAGKVALEEKIQTQVRLFLSDMARAGGSPLQVRPYLARAVSNVVSSWLMSVTYSEEDKRFCRLLELIDEGFRLLTLAVPVNFIPFLRFLPGQGGGAAYRKICSNKNETEEYFREIAEEHRHTLDPEQVRDFVDVYLLQLQKKRKSATPVDGQDPKVTYFSEKQLIQVLCDIYSAGLETVTSTLEWAVLFLMINPEVQRKIQKELDEKVGRNRFPELSDIPDLHYTEATILEVLRRANVIVLGNAHATVQDAELGGYFIPKDTHVLPNLWAIHMDPTLWNKPEEFNPDRFLNEKGKVQKPDYFMPFSVGRRMCLGDVLTKYEVFLFLTGLLHQFNLRLPEGDSPPSTTGRVAVSLTPNPFSVIFEPRETPQNRPLIARDTPSNVNLPQQINRDGSN